MLQFVGDFPFNITPNVRNYFQNMNYTLIQLKPRPAFFYRPYFVIYSQQIMSNLRQCNDRKK